MNVYDTANRLAQEIKTSNEYLEYKKAKEKQDEEKTKKLQEMYGILIENKDIKNYFDLEVKFNVMIADVNKIIAESVKEVL